jgi:hypothetical protein
MDFDFCDYHAPGGEVKAFVKFVKGAPNLLAKVPCGPNQTILNHFKAA